ncbi:MAG: hypothetical protein M1570_02050 [Chloroflexi bacterium]|nr:hypothetical protein [Chloroflexota bacterium]
MTMPGGAVLQDRAVVARTYRAIFRDWAWLLYSVPCIAVWSIYLLSFFPGLMSRDSIQQWKQIVDWKIVDSQPAFHTLTNWLITRIWFSPAAVAVAQILAFAVVFAVAMRELGLLGVSRRVRVAITVLFSLSPVNGFMSIVLWKDIPYTIALVAVWLLVLRIVRTRDAILASPGFLLTFSLLLVAASLYRINGIFVAILLLIALAWLYKTRRVQIVAVGIVWLTGFFLVKSVLYPAIGVISPPASYAYELAVHQVVGLRQTTPLTSGEANVLDALAGPEFWAFYRCGIANQAIVEPTGTGAGQFNQGFLASHTGDFLRIWLALILRNPHALFEHQVCISNLEWQVVPPLQGAYMYTVQLGIDQNDMGLATQTRMPLAQSFLANVYEWSMSPGTSWWFWRPALYAFLAMGFLLLAPLDLRDQVLLLLIPLIQTVVMVFLIPDQDTRYQYPVYVIALIAAGLLFAKRRPVEPAA